MLHRHYLTATFAAATICLLSAVQFVAADTYEFEVTRQTARPTNKSTDLKAVDLKALKNAATSGKTALPTLPGELLWQPPEKSTLTVKTGPQDLFIQGKDICRIYDFKNMTFYDLNKAAMTYCRHSLYADLAFRQARLRSRLALGKMLEKALKKKHPERFWHDFFSEEMFALALPDVNSGYSLEKSSSASADIYKFNSLVVTSCTAGASISPEKMRQLSRFLIYGTHLHPEIRQDMEKSAKLPQRFMCYLDNRPASQERTTFVLKKATAGDFAALIPKGYTEAIDARSPLSTVYPRIKELGGSPPANLKQLTLSYYAQALEKKNYLDALLAVSEYGLQTGENLTAEITAIKDQISKDPDCCRLIAGLQAPETGKQAAQALASLDRIDRTRSSKSYLIDVFRANLLVSMNESGLSDLAARTDEDPVATFVKALKQNPFIAGVYHDLGNYLESTYRQPYAWECYDLACKFYPGHPFMKDIAEREQELNETYPQFFNGDKL